MTALRTTAVERRPIKGTVEIDQGCIGERSVWATRKFAQHVKQTSCCNAVNDSTAIVVIASIITVAVLRRTVKRT